MSLQTIHTFDSPRIKGVMRGAALFLHDSAEVKKQCCRQTQKVQKNASHDKKIGEATHDSGNSLHFTQTAYGEEEMNPTASEGLTPACLEYKEDFEQHQLEALYTTQSEENSMDANNPNTSIGMINRHDSRLYEDLKRSLSSSIDVKQSTIKALQDLQAERLTALGLPQFSLEPKH